MWKVKKKKEKKNLAKLKKQTNKKIEKKIWWKCIKERKRARKWKPEKKLFEGWK